MKLGVLVFSDPSKLALLESMLHPRMATAIMLQLEDARRKNLALVVLNAALLHRMHLDVLCDAVCFVDAPACIRYFRARKRDGATVGSFRRRLAAQHDVRLQDIQCQGNVYLVKNFLGKGFIHRQVTALCVTMGV